MNDLISRLSELRCQYNCFDENERDAYHTLSEAIKALSDVPDTNVGDTISRQAAIDAFRKELCREREYIIPFKGCERVLSNLPSADELTIVTEYCRKRNLVIITMESFRVLQEEYYNRQNGMDGEQDVYSK